MHNGRDYDALYDIQGTIEYDAHTTIESELLKEFLCSYIAAIDASKTEQIESAIRIIGLLKKYEIADEDFIQQFESEKEYLLSLKSNLSLNNE